MKQLLILSGKGGTGKTTVASAFIKLANAKAYADCDVDAPNLHLVSDKTLHMEKEDYYGLPKAFINEELCIKCGKCYEVCKFDSVLKNHEDGYHIDYYGCEGCGVCHALCPVNAITMEPDVAGEMTLYSDSSSVFSTAELKMGSGTSGKLVTQVKNRMKSSAKNADIAIIDGSPGIGCPVIASLSGVDMVLIVAEPSLSGISDMKRIVETAQGFGVEIAVCINKFDTNINNYKKIKDLCREGKLSYVGEIPFDKKAITAVNSGKTIVDMDCHSGDAVRTIYEKTIEILNKSKPGGRKEIII